MDARELTQIGPYRVRRFVAEGGMAWVFEVNDPRFEGRDVVRALKMLKPSAAIGEEFQRFRSEAGLLAGIDHPNLITIFDFGKDDATDCFYYTMTYVDGPTMSDHLREHGPFSIKEGVRIFADLLGALAELHDRQIVHRDIKPANVLIGSDGRARLADLGIARAEQDQGLTKTGMAVGTVLYMSPEQARGREVKAASDVFSVGLTLYEALTGRVVYDHIEDIDSTSQHDVLGYLVSLSRTGEELEIVFGGEAAIPGPVKAVIEKACRFLPDERYPDARAMRTALEQTVLPALPVAKSSRWPWIAAAAATVVAAAAAGLYFFWTQAELEARVRRSLDFSTQMAENAPAQLERLKDLVPAPPREMIEKAEATLERAELYLVNAQEDLEAGSIKAAEKTVSRAQTSFDGVCQQLAGAFLSARADKDAAGASTRVAALREAGAAEHLPDDWAALEAQLAALAPPTAALGPCGIAAAQLDRIDAAAQTQVAVASLERGLGALWPRLAGTAQGEAEKARKLAEAESVDAPQYVAARDRARDALAEGRRLEKAEDFLGARGRYQEAAQRFQTAAAIVPAAKARAEVRRLEDEAATGGAHVRGVSGRMISQAGQLYDAGQWTEAAETYRLAAVEMRRAMAEGELEQEARRVRTDALATREIALREGAERSAAAPLARGDESRGAAETALSEQRYDEAEAEFRRAQTHYAEARDAAIEAMAAAHEAERDARDAEQRRLGPEGCGGLESQTAGDECKTAIADLRRGAEAIENGDASIAVRSYQTAIAALDRALAAEDQYQGNKPRPPKIESRTPRRETLEVFRNRSVKLAVEAVDPNAGDRLRYTWTVDGQRLDAQGPEMDYRPKGSGRVAVTVDDGRGGSDTASWEVVLKNRKPSLSVRPGAQSVALTVGESKAFAATVNDPDGDTVSTEFVLDGQRVASGPSYTFSGVEPGKHTLEVIATDAGGARTALRRSIEVRTQVARSVPARKPEPPAPTRVPEPTPQPPVAKKPPVAQKLPVAQKPPAATAPSVQGWEAGVYAALQEYEAALDQKDMDRLQRVWIFKPGSIYKKRWESKFRKPAPIEVSVDVRKVSRKGDHQASVVFEQTESSGGRSRTFAYEAVLMERTSTGEWQIVENHIQRN